MIIAVRDSSAEMIKGCEHSIRNFRFTVTARAPDDNELSPPVAEFRDRFA
jgi:hypothetical protein